MDVLLWVGVAVCGWLVASMTAGAMFAATARTRRRLLRSQPTQPAGTAMRAAADRLVSTKLRI